MFMSKVLWIVSLNHQSEITDSLFFLYKTYILYCVTSLLNYDVFNIADESAYYYIFTYHI